MALQPSAKETESVYLERDARARAESVSAALPRNGKKNAPTGKQLLDAIGSMGIRPTAQSVASDSIPAGVGGRDADRGVDDSDDGGDGDDGDGDDGDDGDESAAAAEAAESAKTAKQDAEETARAVEAARAAMASLNAHGGRRYTVTKDDRGRLSVCAPPEPPPPACPRYQGVSSIVEG